MKNLYDVLGIKKNASKDDIKKAYRSKSMVVHPDRGGNDEEFSALEEANRILSDDETREQYDRTGEASKGPPSIEQQARAVLGQMFLGIISGAINSGIEISQLDAINSIRESLKKVIQDKSREKENGLGIIEKTRKAMSRVSMKSDDTENALAGALEAKINDYELRYLGLEQDIALHEKAIEQLENYDYEFDKPEPQANTNYSTAAGSIYFGK